ncbi:hypothetical protein [Actinokineospora globicatena]|uniref:hypothetical protein n=1 Tax=Actinokineospora globicatena TaxID=103729 RepID=UPI0020A516E0|nr:hypothetical protein [Actinokineospora globicatena]MCP2300492.1 hypothetical protein [Actinokineospora globicatena]GLW81028.1 hypothetical protein Aglo01_55090 [Actinokineospora globicatena]GLW88221.1 hypothetical protein Aglo02_58600 [Actinokineospora globicatena]
MTSPDHPARGKRYYLISGTVLAVVLVVAITLIDRAPWLLVLSGPFVGGFILNAILDLTKRRNRAD